MSISINDSPYMQKDRHDILKDWDSLTFKSFCSDVCLPEKGDFYQIILLTRCRGSVIIGGTNYLIENNILLFVHPNTSISWKSLSLKSATHFVFFKEAFLTGHPQFKAMLHKFGLFQDKDKSVICLNDCEMNIIYQYFEKMQVEEKLNTIYREDSIQAMLQLVIVEVIKAAHFLTPDRIIIDNSHIDQFFYLLEKEISGISFTNPIRIKTAKEFASSLQMHPNYLNVLLKKKTGQNISTHIRNRLIEEAKTLLLHTNWNLQDIAYCVGFSEQSNFNLFFKKNTGLTPAGFRRGNN